MSDWPLSIDSRRAIYAADQHMIKLYDDQPQDQIAKFQNRHISKLFMFLSQNSRWWRQRIDVARTDNGIDFNRIPLLTREQFRASLLDAEGPISLPGGHGSITQNKTSGSSGVPLSFFVSGLAGRMNEAHYNYDRTRHGIAANGLLARLTAKIDDHVGPHLRSAANPYFGRCEEFGRLANKFTIEEHARWISEIQPDYIYVRAGMIDGIIEAYQSGLIRPPSKPVKSILSFAETVTSKIRTGARETMNARIIDRYSCEEVGALAFQCPVSDEHMHIAGTNAVVEVLDSNDRNCPPGQVGRVFVTSLHNYASPAVRYELGDLSAWAPQCICGYNKPVLFNLLGRIRFTIRLPSGERKHVAITAKHWLSVANFKETRIVQVSGDLIKAEYAIDHPLSEDQEAKLISIFKAEISPSLDYKLERVESIDWGPTYKRQDIISLI